MKIANIITFTTGSYENKTMLVRPYKLTHEGARRILQRDASDRFEDEPCTVTVCVTHINAMIVTK
jgi:hypothetical protein